MGPRIRIFCQYFEWLLYIEYHLEEWEQFLQLEILATIEKDVETQTILSKFDTESQNEQLLS